jgi:histidinol phosphatase-like enzyme
LNPKNSYLVGDQAGDMELAARVGAQGVLISQTTTVGSADIAGAEPTLDNLLQAAPMDRQPNWAGRLEARES